MDERFGITQFTSTYFSNWKFKVDILLRKSGVAHCLTEEIRTDVTAKATFDRNYATAIALLVQCVADSHLEYGIREGCNHGKCNLGKVMFND